MTPYLFHHIPEETTLNASLRSNITRPPFPRTERYDNSFFPSCINSWNTLDNSIKSLPSLQEFKYNLNKLIRPKGNSFCTIRDNFGIKLLTKIRVTFSDLRDHRYNHTFNCINPTCSCGLDDETSVHYLLCCQRYVNLRTIILAKYAKS